MVSVRQCANSAHMRNAALVARARLGVSSTRAMLATEARRFLPTKAKKRAAHTGGEYRFHHSGPYAQPRYMNLRQNRPSKRKVCTSRNSGGGYIDRQLTQGLAAGNSKCGKVQTGPGREFRDSAAQVAKLATTSLCFPHKAKEEDRALWWGILLRSSREDRLAREQLDRRAVESYKHRMPKQAVSVTLEQENLLWLRGQVRAARRKSLSEVLDSLVAEARTGGLVQEAAILSVVGTIRIADADPDLRQADAAVRSLFPGPLRPRKKAGGASDAKPRRPDPQRRRPRG